MSNHAKICPNIPKTNSGPTVSTVKGKDTTTKHTGTVPLSPTLSQQAQQGNILNGIATGSLISIGQLCNDDCIAIFTKHHVKILKDNKIIITGTINDQNGLWNIPLTLRPSQVDDSAFSCQQRKSDLADFLHGAALSPIPSTFLRAIKRGHISSWPGLTTYLIKKHLPKSLSTSKGHLRGQQKNI